MFAYYGEVSVEFKPNGDKNLFCIYGDNGFGKTSFIRSAKLLFLGTNMMSGGNIPETIARFTPKVKNQKQFICGNKEWNGILNQLAIQERESLFFVCFEGKFKGREFSLKRSWEDVFDDIREKLYLKLGDDEFVDDDAQEKVATILPPSFVEFFFFDGEEIEKISDNLRTQLRSKIEDILQISPLDSIIKQAKKYQDELKDNEIKDKQKSDYLSNKRIDLGQIETQIQSEKDLYEDAKQSREECDTELKELSKEFDRLISDSTKEQEKLISQRDNTKVALLNTKKNFSESLKQVIFVSNSNLVENLQKEIDKMQNIAHKGDIEALKRLMPKMLDVAHNEILNNADKWGGGETYGNSCVRF